MRQTISGLVAALAVMAAGIGPAAACGIGCGPCGYVSPCGAVYVQPYYAGYAGFAGFARLPDPEVQYHNPVAPPQYYYVEQGPTYTGPGNFAPRRVYRQEGIYGWGYHHGYYAYRHYPWRHHHWYRYGYRHVLHSYY